MPSENNHCNYSIYDNMSTKMLEEILRADSQLSDCEEADTDAILYIMGVIASREEEYSTGRFTDINTAWQSFNEHYMPYIENNKSLYDDEDIKKRTNTRQISFFKFSLLRKMHRLTRGACIAAIITIFLLTGTVTAKAFGFDLWSTVAKWTRDTFGFSHTETQKTDSASEYDSLQEALNYYGIKEELVPTWFPERYSFRGTTVTETPMRTTIYSTYQNNDAEILVTIISLTEPSTSIYEKDESNVIVYTLNGLEHYLMTNMRQTKVVWITENYECSITGVFSFDEAKTMINSIYKEVKNEK